MNPVLNEPAPGLVRGPDHRCRCFWASSHADYRAYHDCEWGVPVSDDRALFEKVCLEGFQAGLSWLTILRKRENFRSAFANFEIERVAEFTARDVKRLLANPGIIRHRGKIEATINNARRAREMAAEGVSLASFLWQWEPDEQSRPARIDHETLLELTTSQESKAMSKALKRRGWRFVGPTTAYSLMQAMGLVNDHLEGCFARGRIAELRDRFVRPPRP